MSSILASLVGAIASGTNMWENSPAGNPLSSAPAAASAALNPSPTSTPSSAAASSSVFDFSAPSRYQPPPSVRQVGPPEPSFRIVRNLGRTPQPATNSAVLATSSGSGNPVTAPGVDVTRADPLSFASLCAASLPPTVRQTIASKHWQSLLTIVAASPLSTNGSSSPTIRFVNYTPVDPSREYRENGVTVSYDDTKEEECQMAKDQEKEVGGDDHGDGHEEYRARLVPHGDALIYAMFFHGPAQTIPRPRPDLLLLDTLRANHICHPFRQHLRLWELTPPSESFLVEWKKGLVKDAWDQEQADRIAETGVDWMDDLEYLAGEDLFMDIDGAGGGGANFYGALVPVPRTQGWGPCSL